MVNNRQSPDGHPIGSGSGSDQECMGEQQLMAGDRTSTQQQHPMSLNPSSVNHDANVYGGPQSYPQPLNQQQNSFEQSDFSDGKVSLPQAHSSLPFGTQGSYGAHGSGATSPRPRGLLTLHEQPLSATSHGSKQSQQTPSGLSSHSGGNAAGLDDQYATTAFSNR